MVVYENFAEEEMRHLTVCDKVMREKGKVNLNFALCLLNGPPRVGKSTFLSRITGRPLPLSANDQYPISETPSTGVAERVLQVVIKKASLTIAMASQSSPIPQAPQPGFNWQIITLSQEAVMMLKAILSSQPSFALEQLELQMPLTSPSDVAPTASEGQSTEATNTAVAETNRQPISVEPAETAISHLKFFNLKRHKKSQHYIPGYQVPLRIFQEALRSKEWASAEDLLKLSLTLYFTDVGGQPEFQEVLPAIIAGPSIFFVVFKLPDGLHQKYKVQYIESLSHKSITYESSFTVLESILQSLASIASMCSHYDIRHNDRKLKQIRPKVVLVGTHKDQTDARNIRSVQRELNKLLKETDYVKEGIIRFASPNEPVLTINNLSEDETDAANIRHIVQEIAHDPAFTVPVPAPWLALLLSLRRIESSVISYYDCLSMAKDCGIHDDEELKEALWFLHTKLGVIRYFDEIPELRNIVICDPQVIFDKITTLISRTFKFEETPDVYASNEFKEKGIFPARIIDEISSRSNEPLSEKQLVVLLTHLRIIAPIYDEEEQESASHYLLSCVLSHAKVLPEESCALGKRCRKRRRPVSLEYPESRIPSLCILFQCGYCPKGIFGAVIADLMKIRDGALRWRLKRDAIYRNQVTFHVGREYHLVKLSFFCKFLEVEISSENNSAKFKQLESDSKICSKIRLELERSLISVCRMLRYGRGARFFFGFYSSCCNDSTPAKCDEEDPVVMLCDQCGSIAHLQDNHRFWFSEKKQTIQVLTVDDLQKIQRHAWEARANWYNIGLELKIDPGTLDVIKGDSDSIADRFRGMLSTWLGRDQLRPTLSSLAEALCSPTVGYEHLAEQILTQK